jgi:biotin operon repressor
MTTVRDYLATGIRADLVCLLCAHMAGTAERLDGTIATRLRPVRPEDAEAVRALLCPRCSGRLWSQDAIPFVVRRPLTTAELMPTRGRPPGPTRIRPPRATCPDCSKRLVSVGHTRCLPCAREHRLSNALRTRLVLLLADGEQHPRAALCLALNVSSETLSHVITKAREAGYQIERSKWTYRLERAS